MGLKIQYWTVRSRISNNQLEKLLKATPQELAKYLSKKGLVNPSINVADLKAYWEPDNTIRIYWKGHELTGRVRFPKKC